MQDVKSRDKFVDQVGSAIAKSEAEGEAFIFGISGKWGEGKTFFLKDLCEDLQLYEYPSMKVVWLNPWKFAHADNSMFRELLQQIAALSESKWDRFILKRRLHPLYHDTTEKSINWGATLVVSLIFLVLGLLYRYPPDIKLLVDLKNMVTSNKIVFTALLIPVFLAVANSITTSQSSTKATSTRDEFDNLLKLILSKISLDKVVVYVDDLDRLTAEKAISVLDSLRTFFDNEKLVFVVASDSSVLERHLGRELMPSDPPVEQMAEGRRFLKKIFNVYWRLPIPTKPEYEDYIKSLVGKETNEYLYGILKTPSNRKSFRDYLSSYFSNNFRNAERFIKRVEFTFRLIEAQLNAKSGSKVSKDYFLEMLENPLLVIRVLLIEELANPLFEEMQHRPALLIELEQMVTDGEQGAQSYLTTMETLSKEQRSFMDSFLPEKPRFKDEGGVKVKSIEPYIFLSSDSSFGDIRGLSPDEFATHLSTGQISELVSILSSSGEEKLEVAVNSFFSSFYPSQETTKKVDVLYSLVTLISGLNPKLPAQSLILQKLSEADFSFINDLQASAKVELIDRIGTLPFNDQLREKITPNIPGLREEEWANISYFDGEVEPTSLLQEMFLVYFRNVFPTNTSDMLTQLGPRVGKFSPGVVNKILNDQQAALVDLFISDNSDDKRAYSLLLIKSIPGALDVLKQRVREQVGAKNTAIFNWLYEKIRNTSEPLLTNEEILDEVFSNTNLTATAPDLVERISLFRTTQETSAKLWDKLFSLDEGMLMEALFQMVKNEEYLPIAPSSDYANRILAAVVKHYVSQENIDSSETARWLARITPHRWLFSNLKLSSKTKQIITQRLKRRYIEQTDQTKRVELERILSDFA